MKKSKYPRVSGWDDSDGFLTPEQVQAMLLDEIMMSQKDNSKQDDNKPYFSDEFLDIVEQHSSPIKTSEKNKKRLVFPSDKPEHPLGKEGLKRAYENMKDIEINPDDLDSIS